MPVVVIGGAIQGVDAIAIEVEVDLLRRLPSVAIVGLAASAVKESAERVRSAITSSDHQFPRQRVVVNLAPADVRKEGTAFDLPMALAILAADGQLPEEPLNKLLIAGELSLGGRLRPVRGALSLAMLAREQGRMLLLPHGCAAQARLVPGVEVHGAHTLDQVIRWLRDGSPLPSFDPTRVTPQTSTVDLSDVRGQGSARRALEIAASGGHHLLMMGPPGCGKSMLARRIPTILPPLTFEEALETTRVHSVAGLLPEGRALLRQRPFRSPHHSVTVAGLIGSASLRPGEVSLAHNGVLFLDEATEFRRAALEVLREPLEEGLVRVTRAAGSVRYPARVMLVMASNPCPCGRRGSPLPCECTDSSVRAYRRKLSGPILDRIDLHIQLEPVTASELFSTPPGESSANVLERVLAARDRQRARGQRELNGRESASSFEAVAAPTAEATQLLRRGMERHRLSGRSALRLMRVARTIADLAAEPAIHARHVAEALAFRPPDGVL